MLWPPGDEILGLSRGLLGAGAQCLMLTLWDVHDRSTAEFMSCFYRRLQGSQSKAQALREAMRNLRDKYPHPYYWAPFFLTGKAVCLLKLFSDPLYFSTPSAPLWVGSKGRGGPTDNRGRRNIRLSGEKMARHFRSEEWVDFARSVVGEDKRKAMQDTSR